mgnify:CR=1 FL=1
MDLVGGRAQRVGEEGVRLLDAQIPEQVRPDGVHRLGIAFSGRELEHFAGLGQTRVQVVERADDGFKPGALAPQFLSLFRVAPDVGVFEFAVYFFETVALCGIVKGTP